MTETYARSQVEIKVLEADQPADLVVHTVWHHHSDESGTLGPFDPVGHAQNVANVFFHGTGGGSTPWTFYQNREIHVKVYNMADMKPRPIVGEHVLTPAWSSEGPLAPRELAIALRYYAARNIVGQRGRMFLGPWLWSIVTGPTIPLSVVEPILDLATALAAIGGAQMSWCMHSDKQDLLNAPGSPGGTTSAAYHDITQVWLNDQWQHMESRETAEVNRWTQAITPGLP